MQEQVADIIFYAKGTLRHRWLAIIVAWLICLLGWVYIMAMPNQYISEAQVHVDSRSMLRPLLRGLTVQSDTGALVRVMKQLMFTNKNLEKIAHLAKFKGITQGELKQLSILTMLKEKISISGGKDDLFEISYSSSDPKQSKNVVLAVLTVFSEQAQIRSMGDVDSAQRFLDKQIQEYEKRLVTAEQAREEFKRVNFGLLPETESDQMAQLYALTSKLDDAKLNLDEALSRKRMLQIQLNESLDSEEEWTVSTLTQEIGDGARRGGRGLSAKIEELKSNRTDLFLKYTENHPSIVSLDNTIKLLEQHRKEKGSNSVDAMAMVNPYIQSLKEAANQASAEVAALQSRVGYIQKRMDEQEQQLDSRLKTETAMQNLNRDYNTVKENYMKLLQRREQATMSGKLDIEASSLKLKVVDPPKLPLKPDSPNRFLLNPVVLILGLLGGFGVALFMYFIRPVYMSVRELRESTGLPVLGTVSMQVLDDNNSVPMYSFLLVASGLLAVFMIIMMVEVLAANNESIYQYVQNIYWQLNTLVGD
jgi:polysaccharide chain length determinant protein (PEP-CTERM system associated)